MRALTIFLPVCLLGMAPASVAPAPSVPSHASPETGSPAQGLAAPRGRYVEARTASVFAGACHYGAESTTRGREALLVWHIDSGGWGGVDLAGVNVALAVAGDRNLDEAGGSRHSLIYTDARSTRERRAAAADFVRTRCRELAGEVRAVESVEMTVAFDGESYRVSAPEKFELRGSSLENRECCKMPYDVWYAPFVDLCQPIVGCDELFRFEDRALGPIWSRASQNESFVGRFGAVVAAPMPADRPAPSNCHSTAR